MIASQIGILF